MGVLPRANLHPLLSAASSCGICWKAMDSMSNFFINQVNPKFKEYNRPLFLAIVVFIPTAVLTLLLFYLMVSDCETQVKVASDIPRLRDEIEGAHCVVSTTFVQTTCRSISDCSSAYAGGRLDGTNYCPAHAAYYEGADWCDGTAVFMAEIENCPAAMPTLGAALGYAGFIELALTVCIVFGLTQTGCIAGGPKGHMGQMIKEIIEGKDTGKEIADVVGESA